MKSKSKFGRFLSNDITLMVLSVVIALIMWFIINAGSEVESSVPIRDIPITIELSQEAIDDGLQVFYDGETTATVEVSGNRLSVGSLSASDIKIVALDTNSIKTPGHYTLDLKADKVGVRTNYSFASNVNPSTIDVYVDRYKEKTFTIVDEIVYKVDSDYFNNSSMSETSVTVAGPETEVNSIDRVVIQGTLEGSPNKTTSEVVNLVFLDKDGNKLNISMSDLSTTSVTVTMKPLPTAEVSLIVDAINAPVDYPKITINPDRIKIAAEQSVLDSITANVIDLGSLDFSMLDNKKHSLSYDITLPNGCKNLSGYTSATIEIDLSGYSTKQITVKKFSTANIDTDKYSVAFNNTGFEVTVCGPSDVISQITADDIIPKVDFSGKLDNVKQDSFSLELPFVFEFSSEFDNCWIFGEHSVVVNVSSK